MNRLHPKQVILDPDEILRANRVAVAHYLGILPSAVDDLPQSDVDDVLGVIWAEGQTYA